MKKFSEMEKSFTKMLGVTPILRRILRVEEPFDINSKESKFSKQPINHRIPRFTDT